MKQYLTLLDKILRTGTQKQDRTGTGTLSIFAQQLRFDLSGGFPLITTKKIHLKSIIYELLWFLSGDTNTAFLHKNQVTIWDEWADNKGQLGGIYGQQWRAWPTTDGKSIDQITTIIQQIKTNPNSRRMIVSAWNVASLPDELISPQDNIKDGKMALPPCHALFQFYVANNKLSCQLYQRSCDMFLGVPFNIASYALLTHMVAQQCNLEVGDFVWTGGDIHLYLNHQQQAKQQLNRTPRALPTLKIIRKPPSMFDYQFADFVLEGYQPHPHIKAQIAV